MGFFVKWLTDCIALTAALGFAWLLSEGYGRVVAGLLYLVKVPTEWCYKIGRGVMIASFVYLAGAFVLSEMGFL